MTKTLVQGGWIVGFDGRQHRLIPDGVVVYEDDTIIFVGQQYPGALDVEHIIDAQGCLVCPGFINMHLHAGHAAKNRVVSDIGKPELFGAGYLNYSAPARREGEAPPSYSDPELAAQMTLFELARFGTTTFVEVGANTDTHQAIIDFAETIPLRGYLGVGYRDAEPYSDKRGVLRYDWDENRGQALFERAIQFVENHQGEQGGLLHSFLAPLQVDTCSDGLLRKTAEVSEELGVMRHVHTAQNLVEYHTCLRRYGLTPIQLLGACGFLGERALLGHTMLSDAHPWAHYAGNDLKLVADSGSSTTHSPLAMMRRGLSLRSLSHYLARGVNVCLGTDTYPRDILSEMRYASLLCKVVEGAPTVGTAKEVFNAVTVNAAKALGRDDLGKLANGAKADMTIISMDALRWGVIYDPIKSLIDCAVGDDVHTVIVNGRIVLEEGKFPDLDEREQARIRRGCQHEANAWYEAYPDQDYKGRHVEDAFPLAFDIIDFDADINEEGGIVS